MDNWLHLIADWAAYIKQQAVFITLHPLDRSRPVFIEFSLVFLPLYVIVPRTSPVHRGPS